MLPLDNAGPEPHLETLSHPLGLLDFPAEKRSGLNRGKEVVAASPDLTQPADLPQNPVNLLGGEHSCQEFPGWLQPQLLAQPLARGQPSTCPSSCWASKARPCPGTEGWRHLPAHGVGSQIPPELRWSSSGAPGLAGMGTQQEQSQGPRGGHCHHASGGHHHSPSAGHTQSPNVGHHPPPLLATVTP